MDLESRVKRLEWLAEKEKKEIFYMILTNELSKMSKEEKNDLIAKHFNMTPCDSLWHKENIHVWFQDLFRETKKMNPKEIYHWLMEYMHRPNDNR